LDSGEMGETQSKAQSKEVPANLVEPDHQALQPLHVSEKHVTIKSALRRRSNSCSDLQEFDTDRGNAESLLESQVKRRTFRAQPLPDPRGKRQPLQEAVQAGGGAKVGVTWGDTRAADKGVSLETHTPKQATPWRESTQLPAHLQRRRSSSFHTLPAAAAQAMAAVELARAMAKQTQNEVATQQAKENRKKLSKTAAAENPVNV